jgi:hypothetical protein
MRKPLNVAVKNMKFGDMEDHTSEDMRQEESLLEEMSIDYTN